jgi:polyphosphate kinase
VLLKELKHKIKRYGFISTGNFNGINRKKYIQMSLSLQAINKTLKDITKIFFINYGNHRHKHPYHRHTYTQRFYK